MVYNTQNYWLFGLFPSSGILENTTFRKLDLFPSSGEGGGKTPTQLGSLERVLLWIKDNENNNYYIQIQQKDKKRAPFDGSRKVNRVINAKKTYWTPGYQVRCMRNNSYRNPIFIIGGSLGTAAKSGLLYNTETQYEDRISRLHFTSYLRGGGLPGRRSEFVGEKFRI
jgi:hypothetical protein